VLIEEWPELPLSRLYTRFSVHNRVRIIACVNKRDVVDAILRHLAKAEAKLPAVHRARQASPRFPEIRVGSNRLCGVCPWQGL